MAGQPGEVDIVDALEPAVDTLGISQAFAGLVIVAIAGNAVENVVGLVVAGLLVLLQTVGLWFGTGLVLSVALAAFGSALIWTRSDDESRARRTRMASRLPLAAVEEGSSRS